MSKLLTADLASIEISRLLHNRAFHLVPFCVSLIHILFIEPFISNLASLVLVENECTYFLSSCVYVLKRSVTFISQQKHTFAASSNHFYFIARKP